MKKIYIESALVSLLLFAFSQISYATSPSGWTNKYEPQKVFIENKGQFTLKESPGFDSKVMYAFDGEGQRFHLTKSGVVFELTDIEKPKEPKKNESEEREMKERSKKGLTSEDLEKMEREERRRIVTRDELRAQWVGANPDVEIITEDKIDPYFSYSFKNEKGEDVNENMIPGYAKVTYRSLYPNIDVVYEVYPKGGIKYSVIVHPGGDLSQVKLQYSKKSRLLANGDIRTKSLFGDFIDHAPATFYQNDKSPVNSLYKLDHNVVSFSVGNYDQSRTLVIDPWTQTPTFAGSGGWQCVWECQKDAANNVYVIGGVSPMKLIKYNSTGTLQWTYNTPYDTAGGWLGTFAVDNPGNSYVTNGTPEAIIQINTAGGVGWTNPNPPGLTLLAEFWSISFNCDQTQMIIGGTGGTLNPTPYIYNVDVATGAVTNSLAVTGTGSLFGIPPMTQEVRGVCACGNGNYYFITHDSIGYIHQGLTSCLPPGSSFPFHVASGYDWGYKCEDWRANNTGIKAIKAFGGYVYTAVGNRVDKRLFNTGGVIGTATIPGGAYTLTLGQGQVSNSGIDIDSCGNVYVGSINEVVKYDANLNQITTYPTSSNFNVYDVQVSPNGNIIAAGSTGNDNSGARTGYVETFAAGACATIAIVCCDATICPVAPVCSSAAPFTLSATTAGGIWSGTGITNTSNGTFSPAVSGVGTFTVYYTLPCGKDSQTVTVSNCSAMTVCRNANGTLTVSGGTAPYTWSEWDSTGQTCVGGIVLFGICTGTWEPIYGWTQFATGTTVTVPAGIDTIKVSDGGATDTIYNPATVALCVTCNMTVAAGTQTNVNCFGASTGVGRITVTGGTSPFTYTWSAGGSTKDSATGLAAGIYTVTVHDAGGCTGTATLTITQPAAAVSATSTTVANGCIGNTGKIVYTASGGTPGYTYIWSPNVSTVDSATGLAAGTYHVTITDSKGCTFTTSAIVDTAAAVTVSGTQTNVNCYGDSTGEITVIVPGDTGQYIFTWSHNISRQDSATGLAAGTYTVTVHEANGCTGTATFTITQPSAPISTTNTTVPTTCANSNGRIVITAAGGTPGYTYTWSPNISTVDSAINLAVGTYNVTVKDSKGCTYATSATVISTSNFSVSPGLQKNVSCFGGNTGAAYVTVSGGTTPYTYTWSPNVSTNDSAVNLIAGTYTVTVHDAGGCSGTSSFTITQPSAAVSASSVIVPATCTSSTGKVTFTTVGGTPAYTYMWSPNVSTVDSAKNLSAGTYQVTITDSKGCTFTTSANVGTTGGITVSPGPQTNVNCFGSATGVAHVTVTGGTTPYTFTWSPNVSTLDSAVGLAAGTYTVTVHDVNGCSGTASFTITQPATALSATNTTVSTTCGNSNGRIVITAAGGTPGYTYTWSPNVSTVDSAVNLAVGTYNVTVKDSKGCTFATSGTVISSSGFSVSPGIQRNVLCFGGNNGAAYVTVIGGTTPYTYTWSPNVSSVDSAVNLTAGTYTVTVHDAGGCSGTSSFTITQPSAAVSATSITVPATCTSNTGEVIFTTAGGTPGYTYIWSPNVSTIDSAKNLSAGTYQVTITDSKGCTFTTSANVGTTGGITVSPGPQTNVNCFGLSSGVAHVTVTGGTSPYIYTWSPNVSTTDSATGLAAGTYAVTVRDANGCTGTASFTITQPATALSGSSTTVATTCGNNNGRVVISASGGTPGYTYTWSPNVSSVDSAINLVAGIYVVLVTDSKGCTFPVSTSVNASSGLTVSPGLQRNILCFGENTGAAFVTVTGGTTPYTYVWSPNVSVLDSAVNLTAGTYTVTVHDAGGCSGTSSFTISQPSSALAATQTVTPAYCGNNNGKVKITPSGGTAGYTYTWSPNVSANDSAINLASGTYLVTVTDANQCTTTVSASVLPITGPTLSLLSEQDVSCNGGSNGKIFVNVAGGTAPILYTWSPAVGTNDSAVGLSQGTYSVTVKDANNCSSTLSVTVNQPALLSVSTTTVLANCGVSNGSATAIATGGVNPLSYQWSVGTSTTAVDSGLPAGSYIVTVTDANHCTALATATISNIGAPTATITNQVNVNCHGSSTGKIVIGVSGGTLPYGYTWSPNVSTLDSAVNLAAGTYIITVNDALNCIAVVSATITQPIALSAGVQSVNADCGQSDGWAKITVNGGAGSYTYVWSVPQTTDSITGLAGGTYYVTVTDSLGCPLVDSVIVGTNSGPVTPTIMAGGPLIFCQGGSVTLTSSATTGNTWSTGATTQSITVTSSGTFTVTQTVGSCTSAPSASVTVVANPIPPAPTIVASGPLSFCQGGSVTLTSSAISGNLWSDNETSQSIVVSAEGTYTVSDTQAGCPSPASAPVTVSIISAPSVVINASQTSLCPGSGSTDTLDATTALASAYLWSSGSTQPTITITAPGTYKVTVTVNGCVGYDSIIINTQPLLGILSLPDSFFVCQGDTVTIDATTLNATSYLWTGEINATTPVITADSEGVYYVKVSNNCGSLNTSTIVSFKDCDCRVVMPNAFTPNGDGKNDYFMPEFDCADPKSLVIRIYDRWGEKVFETNELNGQWDGTYKGAVQPSGVYMYYVEFVGYANNTEKNYKLMGTLTLIR